MLHLRRGIGVVLVEGAVETEDPQGAHDAEEAEDAQRAAGADNAELLEIGGRSGERRLRGDREEIERRMRGDWEDIRRRSGGEWYETRDKWRRVGLRAAGCGLRGVDVRLGCMGVATGGCGAVGLPRRGQHQPVRRQPRRQSCWG